MPCGFDGNLEKQVIKSGFVIKAKKPLLLGEAEIKEI
jgi:hypothetical protein